MFIAILYYENQSMKVLTPESSVHYMKKDGVRPIKVEMIDLTYREYGKYSKITKEIQDWVFKALYKSLKPSSFGNVVFTPVSLKAELTKELINE